MRDDEIIASLWARFRDRAFEQVVTLERWASGGGEPEAAQAAAHRLAGSLGSYGRPDGSLAAAEIETRMRAHAAGEAPDPRHLDDLPALLTRLRDAVA
jgi:HPt (histidine-containing phosphotransfer) domain-containing protein